FYVEREVIGRRGAPALHHSRLRHRIKRRVYLDQIEMLRIPRQSLARWQFLRIPTLHKTRIRPTCRADKNLPAHIPTKSRCGETQMRFVQVGTVFRFAESDVPSIFIARGGAAW